MLTVRRLARPGLHPADLDLAAGECVVLGGPSGAGKSLLLRAVADLDPNEGEVTLDGTRRETLAAPDWRRQVGYLPPESGWWEDVVGQHFDDPGVARELVERVGLDTEALDWPVVRCSTGERQRLALVRLLAGSPRVLLLDEPTSGLDPDSTARVETLLRERLGAGAGAIVVSHDAAQAERLGHRRLRIEAGHLSEGGT